MEKFLHYLDFFSHDWLATVHEVLHADWHDARQLPQPPDLTDSRRLPPVIVLIRFDVSFILSPFCGRLNRPCVRNTKSISQNY